MKSLFLDINVILDIFLNRKPYYDASAGIFNLIERKSFAGYLCALSFPTLYFLLSKELNRENVIRILEKIRIVLRVANVSEKTIDSALSSGIRDFEDAIQYYSAIEVSSDFLITRNKQDFPQTQSRIPIFTPDEFLALLSSELARQNYGL